MSEQEIQVVVFSLYSAGRKSEFGVSIDEVQEIIRLLEITRLPQAPAFLEGVVNLRDKVIPVIGLKKRFGMEQDEFSEQTRIIVFDTHGQHAGVIVDEVSEVLRLPGDIIEAPSAVIANVTVDYLEGVAKVGERLIILLKLERIFSGLENDAIAEISQINEKESNPNNELGGR